MSVSRDFSRIIPGEIDSETKFAKNLSARTLIIMIATFILLNQLIDLVHPFLQIGYLIFSVIISVFVIIPSKTNPEKKMYECIFLSLIKKRKTYKSIDREEALEVDYGEE